MPEKTKDAAAEAYDVLPNPSRGMHYQARGELLIPQPDGRALVSLAGTLAKARLRAFRRAAPGGDNKTALLMYVLDARIASCLHATLRAVEVLLREKIHRALATAYGARWFDTLTRRGALDQRTEDKFNRAIRGLTRGGRIPAAGEVVAELSLGAWVGLLDRGANGQYDAIVWPKLASTLSTNAQVPQRADVHALAKRFNWLRNRINHCEPVIFGVPLVGSFTGDGKQRRRSLELMLEDVRELAEVLDAETGAWIRSWDLIDVLLGDPLVTTARDYISKQPGIEFEA